MSGDMREPDPLTPLPGPGRRELAVPVTPLDAPGRSGRRAAVAATLLVGALGVAIASGQLFPARPASSLDAQRIAAASPGPSVEASAAGTQGTGPVEPSVAATPPPVAPRMPVLPGLAWTDLVAGVRDGSLHGTLVLLSGQLGVQRTACTARTGNCPKLSIVGLDVPVSAVPALLPWDRDPPAGATLVLEVGHGSLTYLGALPLDVPAPVTMVMLDESPSRLLTVNELYPVSSSVLATVDSSCLRGATILTAGGQVPCGTWRLFDDDGQRFTSVDPAAGITFASPYVWLPGDMEGASAVYLVRREYRPACPSSLLPPKATCDQLFVIRPQLVAQLSASDAFQVTIPADPGAIRVPIPGTRG
jgi:hypothetical protein